jgi:hypothetical protein
MRRRSAEKESEHVKICGMAECFRMKALSNLLKALFIFIRAE